MLNRLSLKVKAIVFACSIGIIPMLAIGVIAYSSTNKQIVQEKKEAQQYRANSLNDKVSSFLFERYGDVQIIANLPFLKNPKIANLLTTKEQEQLLRQFAETYGVYDNIAVFDLQGNVLKQSSGSALSNPKNQAYFQEVIKTGKVVISNIEIGKSKDEFVIYFAAPVTDVNTGKITAVVRTQMPISALNDLLADFGQNGDEWHLVDNASGKIFAALETTQVGRDAKSDFPILSQLQRTDKSNTGIGIDNIDGAQQLITYAPFQDFKGLPSLD